MTTRTKSAYVCVLEVVNNCLGIKGEIFRHSFKCINHIGLRYKDFVKILLTVHKRVYDMKHKMDIWVFQEEKNMKNISTKNTKVSA